MTREGRVAGLNVVFALCRWPFQKWTEPPRPQMEVFPAAASECYPRIQQSLGGESGRDPREGVICFPQLCSWGLLITPMDHSARLGSVLTGVTNGPLPCHGSVPHSLCRVRALSMLRV